MQSPPKVDADIAEVRVRQPRRRALAAAVAETPSG